MDNVERHYNQVELERIIFLALEYDGIDLERLALDDLAPIDEFHIRGAEATIELAEEIGLGQGMQVLDVGSGLGGPSRRLASVYGCHVTGLDLTEAFCRAAKAISARLGLDHLVSYRTGNALDMPFGDISFDVLWTQHVAMNIAKKNQLYTEIYRVLKPGGRLAIYDAIAGPGGEVYFPIPWARDPSISFLVTNEKLRHFLDQAGFTIISWRDTTEAGLAWFREKSAQIKEQGRPAVGYHILLGEDFPQMTRNQLRSLNENRMALLQVIAERPAK
ncbi:MAG: methyltransferase domain-containing protein [Deltaproteobacteria bacterium]|jgi:SAM-dependent methyltransferase|nr:methyltransferase domain-containing protein [Deltaproteobacteria bacterium]